MALVMTFGVLVVSTTAGYALARLGFPFKRAIVVICLIGLMVPEQAVAGGTPPDIHVMHRHRIPEFAGFGALADLSDDLGSVGIDPDDWTDSAREAVTYEGAIYVVPMDLHANLWHVNLDIMEEAGLVEDGQPVLPSSPEELLAHARQLKQATGKNYLAADFAQFPIGVRLVLALMWQQGVDICSEDGTATINTEAGTAAVEAITQLFDAGLADPKLNYADSRQSFLNGEVAVLVNGTWVVDLYASEAANTDSGLGNYHVADFPRCSARAPRGPILTCGPSHRR